jgi:hypothetical protein
MPPMEIKVPDMNFQKLALPMCEMYKNNLANRIYEMKNERLRKTFHRIV